MLYKRVIGVIASLWALKWGQNKRLFRCIIVALNAQRFFADSCVEGRRLAKDILTEKASDFREKITRIGEVAKVAKARRKRKDGFA